MARRKYDYALIKRLVEKAPTRGQDTIGLTEAYNRKTKGPAIDPKSMRRIVYANYERWFGTPVMVLQAGRPRKWDEAYILELCKKYPDVPVSRLAEMYRRTKRVRIPASTMRAVIRRARR